jgi:hypothetical protein
VGRSRDHGTVASEGVSTRASEAPSSAAGGSEVARTPGKQILVDQTEAPVQRHASGAAPEAAVHAAAARGTATPASPLPFGDTIQRAFGRHDVSSVQAHTGPEAAQSAQAMGAEAYATRDHVVLAKADLHTVAHEATHVVQQRAGVSLKGGSTRPRRSTAPSTKRTPRWSSATR